MASSMHRRAPRAGPLVGGSLFGGLLIVAGLAMAYLALATPLTSVLSANHLAGAGRVPIALGWSLCLVAGGALLLAGTNRLVTTVTTMRARQDEVGPGVRALASTDDVDIVTEVVPAEGRAIPELAIGPFGAAVICALPSSRQVRQVDGKWMSRTRDGWLPTESPVELAVRDAERVRRWFSTADLDFVVRVYAALIVVDQVIPRATSCAVMTVERLPAWIAALPRQRSLTAAWRLRLRALASSSSEPKPR
jgi:hypothetical protein